MASKVKNTSKAQAPKPIAASEDFATTDSSATAMATALTQPVEPAAEKIEAAAPEIPAEAPPVEGAFFAEAAAHDIKERIIEGTEEMATQTPEAGMASTDRFQSLLGDFNGRGKAAAEKGAKLMEEMTDLAKGNVEALVESSKIATRGAETLGQGAADFGRRSFEEASATLKSLAEVKSPTDFFKLQSDYARSAFDSWVAEGSKASEAMIKLASDVAEPLTTRYTLAAERVKNASTF